jgi:hypothetical protein
MALVQPLIQTDAKIGAWHGATMLAGQGRRGGDALALGDDGTATFVHGDGPTGWVKKGFRTWHDGCFDWSGYTGVRLAVQTGSDQPTTVRVTLLPPDATEVVCGVSATVTVAGGAGWRVVELPWASFVFDRARTSFLQNVRQVQVAVTTAEGAPLADARISDVAAAVLEPVAVTTEIRGRSAVAGGAVAYQIDVANTTDQPQAVTLQNERVGWEAMTTTITPDRVMLAPGERRACVVRVSIPGRIPAGGHEQQVIRVIANGDGARSSTVTFTTASALTIPSIVHTPEGWQGVRDNVAKNQWAKDALAEFVKQATAWKVPEAAHKDPGDTMGPYLFVTANEKALMASGYVWQLSGDKAAAEKVAVFLRRLADPATGYATTWRACSQSFVQEGHFFQHCAMAYDMVRDAGVFSDADRAHIETAFRQFMETVSLGNRSGAINNWNLSEITGAFYCALAIQDLAAAQHFYAGHNGIADQFAKGTMDDGWWYECAISYNVWCTSEFTQVALAWLPWGVDIREASFPAIFSREVMLSAPGGRTELNGGKVPAADETSTKSGGVTDLNSQKKPFGMDKELWGPIRHPGRNLRMMWNSLLPFADWRGVMFGVNDATERQVGGEAFDLAYYVYRDPAYASMVKRGKKRDLIYGVADLPEDTSALYRVSAHADNVGVAMLRSQTENRPIREQIQTVMHYGTHGWAHGHFDRTNLLSLMRYGRSFYNPEMIWYGYEPYMYKFFVQTSMTKNMVVVDRKMQMPTESALTSFHSGKMMQLAAVETNSIWSDPPYGGMVYDYVPVKTFAEKMWREGRTIPLADPQPRYGTLGRFTEPVLQRRAMIVTDDYVVLADRMQGGTSHTYDNLLQLKGFEGLEAATKTHLRHDAQMDTDPHSAAQFITNCDWYAVEAPATARFSMRFGKDADNDGCRTECSEDGVLNMDVHVLWPQHSEVMIGTQAETFPVEKQVSWAVRDISGAMPKNLAEGKSGVWVLGAVPVDVAVSGVNTLELAVSVASSKRDTLFWGDACIITEDGKKIPVNQLPLTYDNVLMPKDTGKDYYGGPIVLQGLSPTTAIPTQPETSADPRIKPKQKDGKDEYVPAAGNAGEGAKPDIAKPALVRIDLRGVKAVRFVGTLGGDFPLGDETQRRKTLAVRSTGTTADFLTVIEPNEGKRMVTKARADGPDRLHVELADGRVQDLVLNGLGTAGGGVVATIAESKNGAVVRTETIDGTVGK